MRSTAKCVNNQRQTLRDCLPPVPHAYGYMTDIDHPPASSLLRIDRHVFRERAWPVPEVPPLNFDALCLTAQAVEALPTPSPPSWPGGMGAVRLADYLRELRSLPAEVPIEPELKDERKKLDKQIRWVGHQLGVGWALGRQRPRTVRVPWLLCWLASSERNEGGGSQGRK